MAGGENWKAGGYWLTDQWMKQNGKADREMGRLAGRGEGDGLHTKG